MNEKTIFINISSDNILISDGNKIHLSLSRNNLESILGENLVKIFKGIGFNNVLVLNGPGGFTNLRVGTLCLNVLNSLLKNQLSYFDISKINLYKAGYDYGILPKYGIIYIGQKKNIRLRNFKNNEKIGQFSFDELKDLNEIKNYNDVFLDYVNDELYYPEGLKDYKKIEIGFDGKNIKLNNSPINIKLDGIKSIAPNYMIDPSITLK